MQALGLPLLEKALPLPETVLPLPETVLPLLEKALPQQELGLQDSVPAHQFLPVLAGVLNPLPELQARVPVQPELGKA